MSAHSSNILLDATSLREGLDNEEEIPISTLESSNGDNETDEEEDDESEISETEDEE